VRRCARTHASEKLQTDRDRQRETEGDKGRQRETEVDRGRLNVFVYVCACVCVHLYVVVRMDVVWMCCECGRVGCVFASVCMRV